MLNTIIDILSENNIQNFLINECKEHTKELFFVKHSIDQSRSKEVIKYDITLYKDFSLPKYKDNIYRGSSTCQITPAMTKDEITNKIKTTYNTARLITQQAWLRTTTIHWLKVMRYIQQITIHLPKIYISLTKMRILQLQT